MVKDSEDIKTVLSTLSGAGKTLTQSVNDYPAQENYLVVRLVLEREEKTLFLYTQGNGYYIEEPYIGVYKYKSDRNTNAAAIYKIYNYSFGPSLADRFIERYSWLDETPDLYKEYGAGQLTSSNSDPGPNPNLNYSQAVKGWWMMKRKLLVDEYKL